MTQKYNFKILAAEAGLSFPSFKKEIDAMLSDPDIKSKFGNYKYKVFSRKQLQILIHNISYLDHLKPKFYNDNPDLQPLD